MGQRGCITCCVGCIAHGCCGKQPEIPAGPNSTVSRAMAMAPSGSLKMKFRPGEGNVAQAKRAAPAGAGELCNIQPRLQHGTLCGCATPAWLTTCRGRCREDWIAACMCRTQRYSDALVYRGEVFEGHMQTCHINAWLFAELVLRGATQRGARRTLPVLKRWGEQILDLEGRAHRSEGQRGLVRVALLGGWKRYFVCRHSW